MPLDYTKPPEELARELREVARDAAALREALTPPRLNYELPPGFPRDQLLDIMRSLAQLPDGTAEGCRVPLEYARNRLPAIRREYVLTEDEALPGVSEAAPSVVRDSLIDERLSHLIASTTTALDAYRLQASVAPESEAIAEPDMAVPHEVVDNIIDQARQVETSLSEAAGITEEITNPTSARADTLKRQLRDSAGLTRLARTELRMPKVVVAWFRRVVESLRNYPELIRHSGRAVTIGVDVATIAMHRWHEFHRSMADVTLQQLGKLGGDLTRVADILERRRQGAAPASEPEPQPDTDALAEGLLANGHPVPAEWKSKVRRLNLSSRNFADVSALAGLTNLQSLNLMRTQVRDVAALAGLTDLQSLDLSDTQVSDVAALAGLTNLQSLDLSDTQVSDASALAGLTDLQSLNLVRTQVRDVAALAGLTDLQSLNLAHTQVSDVSALAGLTNLQSLDLTGTQVRDVSALAGLTDLQSLDLSDTQVSDVAALAGLTDLQSLNLRLTQVSDVSALAGLTQLEIWWDPPSDRQQSVPSPPSSPPPQSRRRGLLGFFRR